jgi:hypothetical protein
MGDDKVRLFNLEAYEPRLGKLAKIFSQQSHAVEGQMTTALLTRSLIEEILSRGLTRNLEKQSSWEACRSSSFLTINGEGALITASLAENQVVWLQIKTGSGLMWHIDFDGASEELEEILSPMNSLLSKKEEIPATPAVRMRMSKDSKLTSDYSFELDGVYHNQTNWNSSARDVMEYMAEAAGDIKVPDEYGNLNVLMPPGNLPEAAPAEAGAASPKMKCSQCGAPVKHDVKFCGNCGMKIW